MSLLKRIWLWLNEPVPRPIKPGEMLPGVERPTRTLAAMIASEVLKQDIAFDIEPPSCSFQSRYWHYKCKVPCRIFRVEARFCTSSGALPDARLLNIYVYKDGKTVELPVDDVRIIQEAFIKGHTLTKERKAQEKKFEQQQKAVDLIADWMGVPSTNNKGEDK